jgi:hypothetical protein
MSFDYRVSYDGPVFNGADAAVRKAVERALKETTEYGKGRIRAVTPVDTGLLKSQWKIHRDAWNEYRIQDDVFYSVYQEARSPQGLMAGSNVASIEAHLAKTLERYAVQGLS